MERKYTKGPWETEDEYVQQEGKPDVGICSVMNMDIGGDKGWFRGQETEANARLISAAPDLLEALIDCRRALEIGGYSQELAIVDYSITKALGETE